MVVKRLRYPGSSNRKRDHDGDVLERGHVRAAGDPALRSFCRTGRPRPRAMDLLKLAESLEPRGLTP